MIRAGLIRLGLIAALAMAGALAAAPASAEDYGSVTQGPAPGPAAAQLDPNDPVPQIGCYQNCCGQSCGCRSNCCEPRCGGCRTNCCESRCGGGCRSNCCGRECGGCRSDCCERGCRGRDRDDDDDDGHGRRWHEIDVDCSGRNREMAPSIRAALRRVEPNGIIRVLSPGEGMTCRESLEIHLPVTIESFGGERGAVIQAPDGAPCLLADIPLGDSLILNGLTIIARGHDAPCVDVRAGHVIVRDSDIDSRNTNWAFDVEDSGELRIENTRVQTDGSGVHAFRAHVSIHGLGIDMSPNRTDAALQLERTDGDVEKVEVVGGRWGILASPGPHGLSLTNIDVVQANTGVELLAGGQGTVHADHLWLQRNRNGLVIGPFVTADIDDSTIGRSQDAGAVLFGADARLHGSKIAGGRIGIRLARADEFNWADVPLRPIDDPPEPGVSDIASNEVWAVGEADVFADDQAFARLVHNRFRAPPHCSCIAGDRHALSLDGNECIEGDVDGSFGDAFEIRPSGGWGVWWSLDVLGLVHFEGGIGAHP